MKKVIQSFRKFIRFIVTIFASREFGFLYCVIGTAGQVTHTYFLTKAISSFAGNFRTVQAFLISFFISSSLLFFVSIADNTDTKENKRIKLAINIFMFIEIVINFYYYYRHLIIDSPQMQVFDFIFAILVSCLLPITIKLYGGLIRAKEWNEELMDKKDSEKNNIKESNVEEIINQKFGEYRENLDSEIANIFADNRDLFLTQFENKCNLILNKKSEKIKETDQSISKD